MALVEDNMHYVYDRGYHVARLSGVPAHYDGGARLVVTAGPEAGTTWVVTYWRSLPAPTLGPGLPEVCVSQPIRQQLEAWCRSHCLHSVSIIQG